MTSTDAPTLDELAHSDRVSIVDLVNAILEKACSTGASDIHIDPSQHDLRIRMRIDGVLKSVCTLSKNLHSEIIARIKVLAKLRSDEHQTTQDGRFRYQKHDSNDFVDIRVSIIPTYYGQNAVLRLLTDIGNLFTLENLGFEPSDQ